jgi:hypothetical protein
MSFDVPSLLFCESLDMRRGELKFGSPMSIWGNLTARDFPVGEIGWDFGDSPAMADWQVLVQLLRYMPSKGAQYCGTVVLPSFLPAGLNYTIYGYAENDLDGWRYDVASPSAGQAVTPPVSPPGKKPDLSTNIGDEMCLATGLAIVLVSFGAAFILWNVRRKTLPPGNPPAGPGTP